MRQVTGDVRESEVLRAYKLYRRGGKKVVMFFAHKPRVLDSFLASGETMQEEGFSVQVFSIHRRIQREIEHTETVERGLCFL